MRLISYNIQATINTSHYLSYLYQWPRQLLPSRGKNKVLHNIAAYIDQFDIACLQEIAQGGLRNGFKNHDEQFRDLTHFQYSCAQTNRRIGKLSIHGNLILSKYPLERLLDTPLPGKMKGRGMLAVRTNGLVIANTHLSLGEEDQIKQLEYIHTQLAPYPNVILCGDFNSTPTQAALRVFLSWGWHLSRPDTPTFPSWKPSKNLDHILVKGDIALTGTVSHFRQSDHLPVIADITSPSSQEKIT